MKKKYYLNAKTIADYAATLTMKRAHCIETGESILKAAYEARNTDTGFNETLADGLTRVAKLLGYPIKVSRGMIYENGVAIWNTNGR